MRTFPLPKVGRANIVQPPTPCCNHHEKKIRLDNPEFCLSIAAICAISGQTHACIIWIGSSIIGYVLRDSGERNALREAEERAKVASTIFLCEDKRMKKRPLDDE
jgi:hypothetical protein